MCTFVCTQWTVTGCGEPDALILVRFPAWRPIRRSPALIRNRTTVPFVSCMLCQNKSLLLLLSWTQAFKCIELWGWRERSRKVNLFLTSRQTATGFCPNGSEASKRIVMCANNLLFWISGRFSEKKRNSTDPEWSFWIERGILIYYSNRAAVQQMAKEGASSEPLKPPHMPSLCHWQTSSKRISHRDRQISIFPFSFKRPSRRTREERKGSSGRPPVPENRRVSPHSCTLKLIANLGKGDFALEALSEWNIDAKC